MPVRRLSNKYDKTIGQRCNCSPGSGRLRSFADLIHEKAVQEMIRMAKVNDKCMAPPLVPLRAPDQVMRMAHIGSLHATRISFMRSLIRRMAEEEWQINRTCFDLDDGGYGTVVYQVNINGRIFSFVAFADELSKEERTDRVIAERWDFTFALHDGPATDEVIERLRNNVPKQEAGRCTAQEFVLARGNKSLRLFDYVVECLSKGEQPDVNEIAAVGYLMRTTAVYGNGKFGMADYHHVWNSSPFRRPFEAQMLVVYLSRLLSLDIAEHVAKRRAPTTAVTLNPALRRYFGVGNSTGLGMAPFLINHPKLLDSWVRAYETALARVRSVAVLQDKDLGRFTGLMVRSARYLEEWQTGDDIQSGRINKMRHELAELNALLAKEKQDLVVPTRPWDGLVTRLEQDGFSRETKELIHSLLIEIYPDLVDDLEDGMWAEVDYDTHPEMSLGDLKKLIEHRYAWALEVSYREPEDAHFFWYRSARKLEPRLGERANEQGAEREMLIGIGREVRQLYDRLSDMGDEMLARSVARFLLQAPECRGALRRVQSLEHHEYGEVRENLLGVDTRPIDLLRCKLAFFGATKFDPKSDLWTRITMFQGAPMPDELAKPDADDWCFATMPEVK